MYYAPGTIPGSRDLLWAKNTWPPPSSILQSRLVGEMTIDQIIIANYKC